MALKRRPSQQQNFNRNSCLFYSYIIFLHISSLSLISALTNLRQIEKNILDGIIGNGNYDSRIRPSGLNSTNETDGPCIVNVNIFIRSISKISDLDMEYSVQMTFREQWNDSRLQYNTIYNGEEHNIQYLTLTDPDKIWKPDLFFRNEKEGHFHEIIMPNVLLRIYPWGGVLYSIRISLVLSCPMDLKYYPLDRQSCEISMASYGYTTEDLVFEWKKQEPVQVVKNLHLPRFTLQKFNTSSCTSKTNTGEYSCIKVDLLFKREFSYYLIQIYIPCSMLVIVSWVSFWLDPNAIPARVSLGVTTLLTMATQISGINASLPPVSYTKAIDVWTGSCLTFVFGALLEFALVNYASRSDCHRAAMIAAHNRGYSAPAAASFDDEEEDEPPRLLRHSSTLSSSRCPGNRSFYSARGSNDHSSNQIKSSCSTTSLRTNSCPGSNCPAAARAQSWENGLVENGENGVILVNGIEGEENKSSISHRNQVQHHTHRLHSLNSIMRKSSSGGGSSQVRSPRTASLMMDPEDILDMIPPPELSSSLRRRGKTIFRRWNSKFTTRSKKIDVISRIFFPLTFALFNLVYWVTYLGRDDEKLL